jgi:hypothetical protein
VVQGQGLKHNGVSGVPTAEHFRDWNHFITELGVAPATTAVQARIKSLAVTQDDDDKGILIVRTISLLILLMI